MSELAGCIEGCGEDVDAIEAYEGKRWTLGKDPNVPGGKG
jgi:hypothetical protein